LQKFTNFLKAMKKKPLKPYRVLLYYKYVKIENPELYTQRHLKFCQSVGLKGRIIIAAEGINGTVSGTREQTEAYMQMMMMDPRFEDIVFKIDEVDDHAFKKMHVRHKKELVTWRLEEDVNPNELTGKRLKPAEFLEAMQQPDTLIIDARNYYEYDLGHFRNAIKPDVTSSREFPDWVRQNLSEYKDKKILTYCTGGVRCEKFTGFLLKEGFKDVAQLEGGIVSYGKDEVAQGQMFDGKCYVFDARISVPIAKEETIISHCKHCGKASDRYVNCSNLACHFQYFCCEECEEKTLRTCSVECAHSQYHEYQAHDLTSVIEFLEKAHSTGKAVAE